MAAEVVAVACTKSEDNKIDFMTHGVGTLFCSWLNPPPEVSMPIASISQAVVRLTTADDSRPAASRFYPSPSLPPPPSPHLTVGPVHRDIHPSLSSSMGNQRVISIALAWMGSAIPLSELYCPSLVLGSPLPSSYFHMAMINDSDIVYLQAMIHNVSHCSLGFR